MYRREMDDYSDSASGLMLFLLGAAIGAGVALLYAPQQGSRTREQLREMAAGAADQTRSAMGNAMENVRGMADRGREYVQNKKDQLSSAYESGRDTMSRESGPTPFTRTS